MSLSNPRGLPESWSRSAQERKRILKGMNTQERTLVQLMLNEGFVTRASATATLSIAESAAAKWLRSAAEKLGWLRFATYRLGRKGASSVWVQQTEDLPRYLENNECEMSL